MHHSEPSAERDPATSDAAPSISSESSAGAADEATDLRAPVGMGRGGRWLRALGLSAVGAVGFVLVAGGAWVGPWVLDDLRLDWVVIAVALDWRDFGHEHARRRLQYELDNQNIGMQVADHDCVLRALPTGVREVRCDWHVDLAVLGSPGVRLPFSSRAVVDHDGRLW